MACDKFQRQAINAYSKVAQYPEFTVAQFTQSSVVVLGRQSDLASGTRKSWLKTHTVPPAAPHSTFPVEVPSGGTVAVSPSGRQMIILHACSTNAPTGSNLSGKVELWNQDGFVRTLIPEGGGRDPCHGAIYPESHMFGCMEWNDDETRILYCADEYFKVPQSTLFSSQDKVTGSTCSPADKFEWRESFGEQLETVVNPRLYVMDLAASATSVGCQAVATSAVAPDTLRGWSLGKAVWAPHDQGVVCTAWPPGRRLGAIYCTNRSSTILHLPSVLQTRTDGVQWVELTPAVAAATGTEPLAERTSSTHNPIFNPDKTTLVFLEHVSSGPHCQSGVLCSLQWSDRGTFGPLVEHVPHDWLYGTALSERLSWVGTQTLVLQTQRNQCLQLVAVTLPRGSSSPHDSMAPTKYPDVSVIDAPDGTRGEWSLQLLAATPDRGGQIVVAVSNAATPPVLMLGQVQHGSDAEAPTTISWSDHFHKGAFDSTDTAWNARMLPVRTTEVAPTLPPDDWAPWSALLHEPTDSVIEPSSRPLIVFPHGGPHSMTSTAYTPYIPAFTALGFVVVCPNYVGSTGFGDANIHLLASSGRVGTNDVRDVHAAAETVIAAGLCDADKVVAFGGSHGGFLSAHLSAQFPSTYKATVIRNPVICMATMVGSTDIPDWCYTEIGAEFDTCARQGNPPADIVRSAPCVMLTICVFVKVRCHLSCETGEHVAIGWRCVDASVLPVWLQLERMRQASPLSLASNVRAPSLVLIGAKDKRVPVNQGWMWHNALRAQGVDTKVRVYPEDDHRLCGVECAGDVFVSAAVWFHRNLHTS
eukprot:m.668060 g.668060  ORF g.668060 m.668060 type:complete len:813 (-) comp22753_c0_seq6:320-2758(-)